MFKEEIFGVRCYLAVLTIGWLDVFFFFFFDSVAHTNPFLFPGTSKFLLLILLLLFVFQ